MLNVEYQMLKGRKRVKAKPELYLLSALTFGLSACIGLKLKAYGLKLVFLTAHCLFPG